MRVLFAKLAYEYKSGWDLIISCDISLAKVMQFVRQAARIMAYQLAVSI